jgi:hypothetical protein
MARIVRWWRRPGALDPVAARMEREYPDVMDRIFGPDPDRSPRPLVDPERPSPAYQAAVVVAVECLAFCEVHPPGHWNCRKACAKPLGHQRPGGGNNSHACATVIYGW